MPQNQPRILCDVPGYTEVWVQFDVSTWGLHEILDIPTCEWHKRLRHYVPKYLTSWNMRGVDGAIVPKPATREYDALWESAFKHVGPDAGRALWSWLQSTPILALGEVMNPSPKSAGDGDGSGDGGGEPAG